MVSELFVVDGMGAAGMGGVGICGAGMQGLRGIERGMSAKERYLAFLRRKVPQAEKRTVTIHILYLESEATIAEELKSKWRRHDELMSRMTA